MDAAAFAEQYEQHVEQIYRFIYLRVHNQADAQDLTAEVFFKALGHLSQYTDQGRPFFCWLYRIAANQVTDFHRRRRPAAELNDLNVAVSSDDLEEIVIRREEVRGVWSAVATLPPGQRMAMTLRFSDDLPLAVIGAVMGRSEAAIKLLIYRAVQHLRLTYQGAQSFRTVVQ